MALLTVPKEYAHLSTPDEMRWVHQERVYIWEDKGYAVNKLYGDDYGQYDVVLMVKEGCEPKPKVEPKKEGKK